MISAGPQISWSDSNLTLLLLKLQSDHRQDLEEVCLCYMVPTV